MLFIIIFVIIIFIRILFISFIVPDVESRLYISCLLCTLIR